MINRAEVMARILDKLELTTEAQKRNTFITLCALDNAQLAQAEKDLDAFLAAGQ